MLTLALEAGEIHNADVLSLVKYFKNNMWINVIAIRNDKNKE